MILLMPEYCVFFFFFNEEYNVSMDLGFATIIVLLILF